MASPGLQTPRAIGGCSLGQPIIFYLSLIHQVIYDMPSTVGGTHRAPSMLHANDDMRTRSGAENNMIGTMVSLRGVKPPELSRQWLRPVAQPGDGRGTTTTQEAYLYITADERAQDLITGAKPAPAAPHRNTNQQPDKRWEKRPREEVHAAGPPASRARGAPRGGERTLDDILDAQCPYHKDMRHTLRNCRDFKHSVGNGRPFQPLPPPPPQGGPGEPQQPQQQEGGGGGAFPRVNGEVNVIFGGHGSQKARGNRSSTTIRYWWRPPVLPPHIDGPSTRLPSLGQISGSTSITLASTRSSLIQ
jgi:hypothetical protein